jgi:Zn-dependent protease
VAVRKIAIAFLEMNLLLAVLNLLPVPPLDGAGVVSGFVPASRGLFRAIENIPYGGIVVFVLLSKFIGQLFAPVYFFVDRLLPYSTIY